MKLNNTLTARAIRFLDGPATSSGVYLPKMVELVQEKFKFMNVPKLEAPDSTKGLIFSHGIFQDLVIDSLEIYNDGIVVNSKTTTAFSDKVIDVVIEWAEKKLNYSVRSVPHKSRMYVSELDFILEKDISSAFKGFEKVYKIINKSFSQNADEIPPVRISGILINYDASSSPHLKPQQFTLDRKVNTPFDTNIYFSRAPLPTETHLEVLKEIEKSL